MTVYAILVRRQMVSPFVKQNRVPPQGSVNLPNEGETKDPVVYPCFSLYRRGMALPDATSTTIPRGQDADRKVKT
jgi:hypothetical protein